MKITPKSFAKTLFSLINENKKLLIGLSGGMDSVVLLDLCEKIIPSGKLFAIHINHGLTKESNNHEKFVYKICIDKNIPLILKSEKRTIKRNESDEMWARRIRYNHYFQTLIEKNYDYVLISASAPDDFLSLLSSNKRLVFFPQTPETLSRVCVEARMMGVELIVSKNVGAVHEGWISLKGETLVSFMKNKKTEIKNKVVSVLYE